MATEGFDESDFILELELYDIVRPPTWQSWNSTSQVFRPAAAPSNVASSTNTKSIATPTLNPAEGFWKNMTTYMLSHYDADDVENMLNIVQSELDTRIESMSLDELERVAASLVAPGP